MKCSILFSTLVFLFFSAHPTRAQIFDDFSDGNFDQNPVWVGDIANFKISVAGELQLNAIGAGQSALFTNGNIPDSSIWDFEIRLAFDPSGSNLLRVYLQSDQTDLATANGYFIEIGETGSVDAIRFFRQDAGTKTLLATGQAGLAAVAPNLHIKAVRSKTGNWVFEAATVGSALQPQFSIADQTWAGGNNLFFGIQCNYTASNASKFFLDNVNIRPDVPDTQPPSLVSVQVVDATHLSAVFDENLDLISAENPAAYSVNNGIGQAQTATLAADQKTVNLTLQNSLSSGIYTFQSIGIKDLAGNVSALQTADFQFIKIEAALEFDILITEIMADPSPSAGLPEVEWLEIFNRSNKVIDLSKIRISDLNSAPIPLPYYLIQAGEYVALTALANQTDLLAVSSGTVLGVAFSPSLLNNDGDMLSLTDASGFTIDRVVYSLDWHTVANKEDGGFSLERINPGLPCLGMENWQSCPATIGGTPASQNASFSTNEDVLEPRLFKAFPESPTSILLTFTEGMDQTSVEDVSAYQLDPFISIASAEQLNIDRSLVRLSLASPLQVSTVYVLSIENSIEDCSQNAFLMTDTVKIGLAEKPEVQDIILNEVLFNPQTGGARYLEFYNRSQKIFDWSQFFLASNSDSSSSVVQILQDRLFLPGEYHVFSNDAPFVREYYGNIIKKNVLQNLLPSLDDIADSIKVYWAGNGQTITVDSFFYYRGLHNGLLSTSEQEGVSIERIRLEGPTQSAANWTSAATTITGAPGSPTLPNSQLLGAVTPSGDLIHIPVARLSPDGDGREDFLEIQYQLPKEGYAASLHIFDSDGNPVKTLVRQNLVGTAGTVRWDGDTNAGTSVKARPGIHILYFEVFSPDGTVKREKKAVVVLGQF